MSIPKGFNKTYNCPICELKAWLIQRLEFVEKPPPILDGFFKQLGDEVKSRGFTRGGEWKFCLDTRAGHVVDDQTSDKIPIGTELPVYGVMTDICPACGTVYATNMVRMDKKH